jgi:hypothetical protein
VNFNQKIYDCNCGVISTHHNSICILVRNILKTATTGRNTRFLCNKINIHKSRGIYWPFLKNFIQLHEIHQHSLHSAKLTVCCAISSQGIIGPYFCENAEGHTIIVNAEQHKSHACNISVKWVRPSRFATVPTAWSNCSHSRLPRNSLPQENVL